ncbi:MAG: hypothetical protein NUW37_19160 [Planctomycetes bacterium]|nr:hypothetical protein [Planctomycetota bacterium]
MGFFRSIKDKLAGAARKLSPEHIISSMITTHGPKVADGAMKALKEEADHLISKKISEAKNIADEFVVQKLEEIKLEIKMMVTEIEIKLDERIEKEITAKVRGLIITLVFVLVMTLISLGYLYAKKNYFDEPELQDSEPAFGSAAPGSESKPSEGAAGQD